MREDWRNEPASEKQKEKLRFFGCTWEGAITKGQASEALDQCAQSFPAKEQEWDNRPATQSQRQELAELGADLDEGPELTYRQAKDWIEELGTEGLEAEVDRVAEEAEEILRVREKEDDDSWDELATACIELYPWLDWPSYLRTVKHVRAKTLQRIHLADMVTGVKELFPERFQ